LQSCRQVSRQAIDLTLRLYDPSLTLAILGSSRDKVCRGLTSDLRRGRRRRPLLESGIYPISKRPKSFRFLKNQICPASQKQESSLKKLCQRQIDVIRGTAMPVNQMECRRAKSGAGPGQELTFSLGGIPGQTRSFQGSAGIAQISSDRGFGVNHGHYFLGPET
jgi:hypothetical protein